MSKVVPMSPFYPGTSGDILKVAKNEKKAYNLAEQKYTLIGVKR